MASARRVLLPLALTAALSGCYTGSPPPAESISMRDDNVFQPGARATFNLSGRRIQPASAPASGHAVELGFTHGAGSGSQTFNSGYVYFGNSTFNAPAALTYEFDLNYVDLAYRYRYFPGEGAFGIEGLVGAGYADLSFAARSGGTRASESLSTPGMMLAAGVVLRFWRDTTAQARLSGFSSGQEDSVTRATRVELSLLQPLGSSFGLRGGYAWWQLESERGGTTSPISVRMRGPTLGLEVMF
jgi:hypothetical protein